MRLGEGPRVVVPVGAGSVFTKTRYCHRRAPAPISPAVHGCGTVENDGVLDELEPRLLRPDEWIREQGALSGIISIIAAVLVALAWPWNGLWLLGIILVIDLLFQGTMLMLLGFSLRSTERRACTQA